MSHVEINEKKKAIENKIEEKKEERQLTGEDKKVLNETAEKKTEKKTERTNAATPIQNQDYFERMLSNSRDQNLVLRIKQQEDLEKGNWAYIVYSKGYPAQKLPTAVKDRKFGSSENDAVKEAKRTFRNADLCTVRELDRMTEYFRNWKNGNPPEPEGKDEPGNEVLNDYVKSILKVQIGEANLTDDYLSQHIHEL